MLIVSGQVPRSTVAWCAERAEGSPGVPPAHLLMRMDVSIGSGWTHRRDVKNGIGINGDGGSAVVSRLGQGGVIFAWQGTVGLSEHLLTHYDFEYKETPGAILT